MGIEAKPFIMSFKPSIHIEGTHLASRSLAFVNLIHQLFSKRAPIVICFYLIHVTPMICLFLLPNIVFSFGFCLTPHCLNQCNGRAQYITSTR